MSREDKDKELNELDKEILKEQRRIRPQFSLANLTRMTDAIMNDASLSEDEKKNRIDEIREDYGLEARGERSFSKLVVHRLGDIYDKSKTRVEKFKDEIEKAGNSKLKEIEETYGKDSVEAAAFKADLEGATKSASLEIDQLKAKSDLLKGMYPGFWQSLANFFKGALEFIGKIAEFIAMPLKLIPGVGSLLAAGVNALGAAANFIVGDWKSGVSNLISAIPLPGSNPLGKGIGGAKPAGEITKAAGQAAEGHKVKVARKAVKVTWDAAVLGEVKGVPLETFGIEGRSPAESEPAPGSFPSPGDLGED